MIQSIIECPVKTETDAVIESSAQLAAALRRLRRTMRRCQICENDGSCPIVTNFNRAFQTAIQEISEEWQLQ
jgi:hypothetical protein